jgi:molybdopterin molybdotransferase
MHNHAVTSELLTVTQARRRVLDAVEPLAAESVAIDAALDRALAQDLRAAHDVPPFSSAAMDGYAVVAGPAGRTLHVVGESRAGVPSERAIEAHEAIRTSTGAALPAGANAVIRQEQVDADGDHVTLRAAVADADDVRHRGEDLAAGSLVLARGTRIGVPELAGAVAAGASSLSCAVRPRVAILCTGTELRAPGEPLGPGEIHNANAVTLRALASRSGAVATRPLRLVDDRSAIEAALARALEEADVIVVTGGVSVGPHDHVKPALAACGVRQTFWGIAIQPGKPTWFGALARPDDTDARSRLVFGLPGTPVAAFVSFSLFVVPALLALQGVIPDPGAAPVAELGAAVERNPIREQAITVRLERMGARTVALPNGPQGANLISSLLGAQALVLIPAGTGVVAAGELVPLWALPA